MTGFHKRKLQKKEHAKKKAQDREKQERLEARREVLFSVFSCPTQSHVKTIRVGACLQSRPRRMLRRLRGRMAASLVSFSHVDPSWLRDVIHVCADSGSDSEWDGIGGSGSSKGKGRAGEAEEEEFEDEEQLATVTVVEEFDPDSLIHGPASTHAAEGDMEDEDESRSSPPPARTKVKTKPTSSDVAHAKAKMKASTKAKDVKYQTNAARKFERQKQRKRKLEKADRAGGKGFKRKGGSKGRR